MRTIIAGTRTLTDYQLVCDAVEESGFDVTSVISGGARGIDALGEIYAKKHNLTLSIYPADWETLGKGAGHIRNAKMASVADALIAISTGSPGTKNMITLAQKKGLKVYVKRV